MQRQEAIEKDPLTPFLTVLAGKINEETTDALYDEGEVLLANQETHAFWVTMRPGPGIRPGDQTARYIDKILLRLTLIGAAYITFVCLLPEFLVLKYNVPFYFGGTSLLIIVVVTMDFWAQVQSYVMSQQYESLLKKANFKTT